MPLPVLCLLSDHVDSWLGRLHALDTRLHRFGGRYIGISQEPFGHALDRLTLLMAFYRTHQVSYQLFLVHTRTPHTSLVTVTVDAMPPSLNTTTVTATAASVPNHTT